MRRIVSREKQTVIAALVNVCHRMYAKGYVAATDGNVSVRLRNGNVLTTRTGVNKGLVKAADIVEINPEGIPLTRAVHPSTEIGMHLFIYGKRPDIGAVVHAHPPFATGFATAREALDGCVFPEVIVGVGGIPLAPYATPSTAEVAASIAPYVGGTEAILLANHGVVTYGRDVVTAYFLLEKVEQTACITFVARMLGGEKRLTAAEVEKLGAISMKSYGKDFSGKFRGRTAGPDREMTEAEIRAYIDEQLTARGLKQ